VTSVDWTSYPILDITEAPDEVDIVLLNRPELPTAGAGESSIRPVAAALANAMFDASGVRLRRVNTGAAEAGAGVTRDRRPTPHARLCARHVIEAYTTMSPTASWGVARK
jgi:hypothetical protein